MNSYLDRLNLRPQERRYVVVVGTVVFLVINLVLVWPHFKDWGKIQTDLAKEKNRVSAYEAEIAHTVEFQNKLTKLEGGGEAVLAQDQANKLQNAIQTQANQSGVLNTSIRPVTSARTSVTQTNRFFEEQAMVISVTTGDKELVDFLVALGSGNSMIRVLDLDLKPDQSQTKLQGAITLVASYQKKTDARLLAASVRKLEKK